jgi:hypothetical protein
VIGRREELALERVALDEHERNASAYWSGGQYALAEEERVAADEARAHVTRLETEVDDDA